MKRKEYKEEVSMMTNKARFINLCRSNIHRYGVDNMLKYLEETDFYEAPASTKYHLSEKGGLLKHSLNVYDELIKLSALYSENEDLESITVVALFHDLCKIHMYRYDESTGKYITDNRINYGGHGSKSVFLVNQYMPLSLEEAVAINCHMGSWEGNVSSISDAYKHHTLAWLLHVADEAATFVVEKE